MTILKDIVVSNHYIFCEGFADWTDAIQAAAEPLRADGIIEDSYIRSIIENVKEYGPYIIIAPEVAMPHSTLGGEGVHDTCLSFMKTEKPVVFDPEDPSKNARLFFTLAATDNEKHLSNMVALAEFLLKDGAIEDLLKAQNADDLIKVHWKYSEQ